MSWTQRSFALAVDLLAGRQLLANPGTTDATATVAFLPDTGQAVTKTKRVAAGQRVTLNIAAEDATLASGAIATAVQSTQPILVERAQYWPFTPDRWNEAHNAFGSRSGPCSR
jgi:hypothetical protein